MLPLEGTLVSAIAAPHPQGYLDRLLEHLEALPLWREGDPEPVRLLLVVARADAEAGTPAGEYIQGAYGLHEDGRVTEVHPGHHRRESYPLRVGRQERERRVTLRFVRLWAAHDRMLPDMVGHPDAVEASFLRDPADIRDVPTEPLRSSGPVEAVELHSELHACPLWSCIVPPLTFLSGSPEECKDAAWSRVVKIVLVSG